MRWVIQCIEDGTTMNPVSNFTDDYHDCLIFECHSDSFEHFLTANYDVEYCEIKEYKKQTVTLKMTLIQEWYCPHCETDHSYEIKDFHDEREVCCSTCFENYTLAI